MALDHEGTTLSVSTTAADKTMSKLYKRGYFHNAGSVEVIVYPEVTGADDSGIVVYIPAGKCWKWNYSISGMTKFRYKTASSTSTLRYYATNN